MDALPAASIAPARTDAGWIAPAPWDLHGNAVIVLLAGPSRGRGLLRGLRAVAFVDYASSAVGPYRELLIVDRLLRRGGYSGATVEQIWVDSPRSVDSGRANWAIPKDLASFTHTRRGDRESWTAATAEGPLAALQLRATGPQLPIWRPRQLGRLLQLRGGEQFATPISVRGLVRVARIEAFDADAARVADLTELRPVAAMIVERGRMRFHAASVDQLERVAM